MVFARRLGNSGDLYLLDQPTQRHLCRGLAVGFPDLPERFVAQDLPPGEGPVGGEQPWVLPVVADVLEQGMEGASDDDYDRQRVKVIESTLASFGAPAHI